MRVKWRPWGNKSLFQLDADDLYGLRDRGVRESYFIEFKERWDPFKVARAVASFANTEGGTVVVGIRDDAMTAAAVEGITFKGDLAESLDQAVRQHVTPIPRYSSTVVPLSDDRVSLVIEVPSGYDTPYVLVKTGQILERSNTSSDPVPPHDRERIRELFDRGKRGQQWASGFIQDSVAEDSRSDHLKVWTVPQVDGGLNLNSVLFKASFVETAQSFSPVPYEHSAWAPQYQTADFYLGINQQLSYRCATEIQLDGVVYSGWIPYQDRTWVPIASGNSIEKQDCIFYADVPEHIQRVLNGHYRILHDLIGYTGPVSNVVKGFVDGDKNISSYRSNVSVQALPTPIFHGNVHRDLDRSLGRAVLDPEE